MITAKVTVTSTMIDEWLNTHQFVSKDWAGARGYAASEITKQLKRESASPCGFCGGRGVINAYAHYKSGMCFKCNGTGKSTR